MGKRRVKRYYRPQSVDLNGIDAVRKILNARFDTTDLRRYRLLYPEELEVNAFDDVSQLFAFKGPTNRLAILAKSAGGRYAHFDCINPHFIVSARYKHG